MKHILVFSMILISAFFSMIGAQSSDNSWQTLFSYEKNVDTIVSGQNVVYALTDGKLFSCNKTTFETRHLSKLGKDNTDIVRIAYNKTLNSLLLIRDDSNIDIVDVDQNYTTISGLKTTSQNIDKVVNDVFIHNNMAYLATNFGLLLVDMQKKEIKESCIFNVPIYSVVLFNNKLYASSSKGILAIGFDKNIQDFANWEQFPLSSKYSSSTYTFTDSEFRNIGVYDNKLFFFIPEKALYFLENESKLINVLGGSVPTKLVSDYNATLTLSRANAFWNFSTYMTYTTTVIANLKAAVLPESTASNRFWVSVDAMNLSLIQSASSGTAFSYSQSGLRPNGPMSNYPYFMEYTGNKIRVVGGNYFLDNYRYPGQLSELEGNSWFKYEVPSGSKDFASVISDPQEPDHLFVCSWGKGLYEYRNKSLTRLYNKDNSALEDIFNGYNYARINGMDFDSEGRLWVTSVGVPHRMYVFVRSNNGSEWTSKAIDIPGTSNLETNARSLIVDKYNNKWAGSQSKATVFFGYNENGTLDDTSDDKYLVLKSFLDENGASVGVNMFIKITADLSGDLWVCTDVGLFKITITEDILDKGVVFNRISTIDNTTGTVSNLFYNTRINSLKVDKANRKWVATDSFGAILLSESGQETLYHFTTDNSPLPSNAILDIAIDDQNDIVYIGTDKGIVSFKCVPPSATEKPNSIFVYPSEVSVNDLETVTISGLKLNSYVKITDGSGAIVSEGLVSKEFYTWNGKNTKGKTVLPGLYYIFGSNIDGTQGLVGKISIMN